MPNSRMSSSTRVCIAVPSSESSLSSNSWFSTIRARQFSQVYKCSHSKCSAPQLVENHIGVSTEDNQMCSRLSAHHGSRRLVAWPLYCKSALACIHSIQCTSSSLLHSPPLPPFTTAVLTHVPLLSLDAHHAFRTSLILTSCARQSSQAYKCSHNMC